MTSLFNFARPPFDCLTAEERQRLEQHLSICYFRAGQPVLKAGDAPPASISSSRERWRSRAPITSLATMARGICSTCAPSSTATAATSSVRWKICSAS